MALQNISSSLIPKHAPDMTLHKTNQDHLFNFLVACLQFLFVLWIKHLVWQRTICWCQRSCWRCWNPCLHNGIIISVLWQHPRHHTKHFFNQSCRLGFWWVRHHFEEPVDVGSIPASLGFFWKNTKTQMTALARSINSRKCFVIERKLQKRGSNKQIAITTQWKRSLQWNFTLKAIILLQNSRS